MLMKNILYKIDLQGFFILIQYRATVHNRYSKQVNFFTPAEFGGKIKSLHLPLAFPLVAAQIHVYLT